MKPKLINSEDRTRAGKTLLYELLSLGLLLLALPAAAQFASPRDLAFWGKKPTACQEAHMNYVVNQTFEGTGYDNCEVWTSSGSESAAIDPDYTGVVLQGAQSLRLTNTASAQHTCINFSNALAEIWIYVRVRPILIDTGSDQVLFTVRNNADNVKANALVMTDGKININATTSANSVDSIANATTYHFWMHRKKATAADGEWDVGFSTDGIRPTSGNKFVQLTGQSNTEDAYQFCIGYNSSTATQEYIFDRVLVATSLIGDNP